MGASWDEVGHTSGTVESKQIGRISAVLPVFFPFNLQPTTLPTIESSLHAPYLIVFPDSGKKEKNQIKHKIITLEPQLKSTYRSPFSASSHLWIPHPAPITFPLLPFSQPVLSIFIFLRFSSFSFFFLSSSSPTLIKHSPAIDHLEYPPPNATISARSSSETPSPKLPMGT